jgi:uncharacterized alpha-E superfamily protein
VMPGGFCRLADQQDARAVTMQTEQSQSADVWVLGSQAGEGSASSGRPPPVQIRRNTGALTSRAADNLFWLGRYIERTDATLRVIRTLSARLSEIDSAAPAIERLAGLLVAWGAAPTVSPERRLADALADVLNAAFSDANRANALPGIARAMRATASIVRDRLPLDAWRAVNDLVRLLDPPQTASRRETRIAARANPEHIDDALRLIAAVWGWVQESMSQQSGWRFLKLGRRLERAIALSRFSRRFTEPTAGADDLEVLLDLTDSQTAYRQRYVTVAAKSAVLDLLLLDQTNPRSLLFQLQRMRSHLEALPGHLVEGVLSPASRLAIRLVTDLHTTEPEQIEADRLLGLETLLMRLSEQVAQQYFALRDPVDDGAEMGA